MADHEVRTEVRQDENRPTTLEERRWLSQLRWIRRAREYSMGWVKHTFRARFGVWVEDAGTDLMRYPDADVLAFSLEKLPDVCIGTGKALCAEEEREKA